ncbi:2083_t:CDS:1, partial [Funneliformis geosporum]
HYDIASLKGSHKSNAPLNETLYKRVLSEALPVPRVTSYLGFSSGTSGCYGRGIINLVMIRVV